jgi:hypothetical protein
MSGHLKIEIGVVYTISHQRIQRAIQIGVHQPGRRQQALFRNFDWIIG